MDADADKQQPVDPSEQDERVRARLLRAAVDVFDRKGYAAASVREIVERAGVSKPALYYHFGSKEGLLLAIVAEATREFEAAVAHGAQVSGDARTRLGAVCDEVYALLRRNVPVVRVAHSMSFGPREGAPAFDLTAPDRFLRAGVERILLEGVPAGEVRPVAADDLMLALMGIVGECIHQEMHAPHNPIGPERMHRILNLLFDGVMEPRAQVPFGKPVDPQENRTR
jgi:TetR/AcrR family transcriptional regulator